MKETPERTPGWNENKLSYEEFRPELDAEGNPITFGPNNMWMNCLIAPDDADDFMKMQMRGNKLLEKIADPADKKQTEELLTEHTQKAAAVMDDREKRREFILSDACNRRLYEIYKIARKHGVTNRELFQ